MFCSECGKQIEDSAKFCRHCGAPISAPEMVIAEEEEPHLTEEEILQILQSHNYNKLGTIKEVQQKLGCDYAEAREIVNSCKWMGFGARLSADFRSQLAKPSKKQVQKERITKNKQEGVACCPKCGSTSITAQKKGFGIGKAVTGAALAGPIGLVAGNLNAKKCG